jgi:hypothetical protein
MFKKGLLVLLFISMSVFSYSYTCFPPITQEGSIAINPAFSMSGNNEGGMETFFYYGVTDKFDICTSILTAYKLSDFSVMSRYAVGDFFIAGFRANPSWATPQLSFSWEDDRYIFQSCLASQFTYDYANKPAMYGVFCPGFKFSEDINICCEINPGYYLQDGDFANLAVRSKGFDLDIVPSLGIQVKDCVFSIAAPIYCVPHKNHAVTFGAWIYYGIKAK